jgi:hypothetical protein
MSTRRSFLVGSLLLAFGGVCFAADKFASYTVSLDSPATGGFAVTASDATVFTQPTRAVWVGGTGNLAVRYIDGTTDTIVGVPTGFLLPIRVDKVLATGTTATSISGLY